MTDTPPITLQLFGAPGADPESDLSLLDPGDWVDFSERLTGNVTWQVGRLGIASQSDPSELNIVLNNDDGWLTPGNNASPYYPYIDKRSPMPLRLLAAREGETPVEQVTCFLKSLQLGFDTTGDYAYVAIKAKGRLDWLDRVDAPVISATSATVVASNPVALWPLTDPTGATQAASGLPGGAPMVKSGTLKFGTGNGGTGQPPILDLGELPNTPGKLVGAIPAGTSSTSWRMEATLNWPNLTPPTDAIGALSWTTAGTIRTWAIDYVKGSDAICLRYVLADGTGTTTLTSTFTDPYDGVARRYRITADQNGANVDVVLYVNDVAKITQTINTQTLGRPTAVTVTAGYNFSGGFDGTSMPAVGGLTFWAPYAPVVSTDTTLASQGYAGEMAGDRLERLFGEAGIPIVVGDGATTEMGIQQDGTFAALVRQCEAADAGLLHDGGPYGAMVYQPRTSRYNRAPDLTLSITVDNQIADGFSGTMDDRSTLKALTVTTTDGDSGSYEDPNVKGGSAGSVELNLYTSENPAQHASFRVALANTTDLVHDALPLGDLAVEDDVLDTWQASDRVGLRVAVQDLPSQMSPLPLQLFADGFTASCDGYEWRVALAAVPARPYGVIVLDSTASTLVSAVDADDTTFTSVVSRPPRWTTTDLPVSLQCGGETPIVATAISDTAIAYVSGNTVTHGNNASLSPSLPGSMLAGDLILIAAAIRGSSATVDVPAGYTRLAGWNNISILGKIHTGSESAPTVTFTGGVANDTTSCAMFAVRNTVSDIDHVLLDWPEWSNPAASGVKYPPMPAPLWDGCMIFYFVWQSATWTSIATGLGGTEVLDSASALGNDQSVAAGYIIQTTTTAIPTGTLSVTGGSSATSRALLIAIAPGRNTLTVVRATNGTAVPHAAGASLQVADTGFLGL